MKSQPAWQRFFWKNDGSELIAYEPDGGALAREQRQLMLVEDASDTLTLLYAGFSALGAPNSTYAHYLQADHFEGVERVFVVHEPDNGGKTFLAGVKQRLRDLSLKVRLIELRMPARLACVLVPPLRAALERLECADKTSFATP